MAEKIVMPQLGESVTEGTISKWLVKCGDVIKKYDPICEVTTDKVNAEIPSALSGTISEIVVKEGETVGVGTLICYIETEQSPVTATGSTTQREETVSASQEIQPVNVMAKQRYSPAVLKLSAEHNIDLSRIQGTGAGGRITRKDVLALVGEGKMARIIAESNPVTETLPSAATDAPFVHSQKEIGKSAASQSSVQAENGDEIIHASSVRKAIASRMVQSKNEIPHAWMMIECDVTNLVNLRENVKEDFRRREEVSLTYLPFFIKAVVEAIKEFPILNSQWVDDQIIIKKAINISIAVATEDALFVPVIKNADQRNILGIAKSIDELVSKTREGKLTADDIVGGTFTVNNTGSFGSIQSAPIINYPQAAILSVESIVKRPVIINNMIAVRDMVNLCLSLDHRILDGLVCGRFLHCIKQKLENYGPETSLY